MITFEFGLENKNDVGFQNVKRNFKSKNFDKVLNVIARNILSQGVDDNGFVRIHSDKLRDAYRDYSLYIDYLISIGFLQRSNYIVGQLSYGYRFTEEFKHSTKIKKIYNPTLKPNPKKVFSFKDCDYPTILKKLRSDYLSCFIDFDVTKNQIEKTKDEWGNFIDIGKWFKNNEYLCNWKKGFRIFSFSTNRLYTNFTFLSSHIRKNNIKLAGENLAELDISNSFPLMLSKHCLAVQPGIVDDYDFGQYCTEVINGTFYKMLTYELNRIKNIKKQGNEEDMSVRDISRSETKIVFQKYLNATTKRHTFLNGVTPFIDELMNAKFHKIHKIVQETKLNSQVYRELSSIETKLIFGIIEELYSKFPGIKILSCHDAIYFPESYKERVKQVWDEHIQVFTQDLPYEEEEDDSEYDFFGTEIDGCEEAIDTYTREEVEFDDEDDEAENDPFWSKVRN